LRPYQISKLTAGIAVVFTLVVAIGAGFGIAEHQRAQYAATEQLPPQGSGMVDPSPMPVGDNWPSYGGTYPGRRYSPLTQIKRKQCIQTDAGLGFPYWRTAGRPIEERIRH